MNLRRGLLRLWMVSALAWVAFIWLLSPSLSEWHATRTWQLGNQHKMALACQVEAVQAGRVEVEREGPWVGYEKTAECPDGTPLRALLIAAETEARDMLATYYIRPVKALLPWALLPPLAVLAFGWVVAWVIRGFRRV